MNIIANLAIHYGTQYLAYFINRTIEYYTTKSQPRTNSSDFSQSLDDLNISLINRDIQTSSSECEIDNIHLITLDSLYHIKPFLVYDDILSLSLTNKTLRDLIFSLHRLKVILSLSSFTLNDDNSEKLQLAQTNNFGIKIKAFETELRYIGMGRTRIFEITSVEDCQNLINFINNNEDILDRIEAINIGDITSNNSTKIEELLNLLAEKNTQLKNLHSFKCGNIYDNTSFTLLKDLENLHFFECGFINHDTTVSLPEGLKNLHSFKCQDIWSEGALSFPESFENIRYFICRNIYDGAILTLPKNLDSLEHLIFGKVYNIGTKQTLEALQETIKAKTI